jgi:hypothetical protein
VLAVGTLALGGCYAAEIRPDGSGMLTREIVIPQGAEPQKFCPGAARGYQSRIENSVCRASVSFSSLREFRELLEDVKIPTVRINQLEKSTDGRLMIDLSVDVPEGLPEYVDRSYYWRLKLPGYIVQHSANQVDGNLLTWFVQDGQGTFRIQAEAQVP